VRRIAVFVLLAIVGCRGVLAIDEKTLADDSTPSSHDPPAPPSASPPPQHPNATRPPLGAAGSVDAASPADAADAAAAETRCSDASAPCAVVSAPEAGYPFHSWRVSTYLGTAGVNGQTDGIGTGALFWAPWGMTVHGLHLYVQSWPGITRDVNLMTAQTSTYQDTKSYSGSVVIGNMLYLADEYDNLVKRLNLDTNTLDVLAGSGAYAWKDGIGTAASIARPFGITTDGTLLYVTDVSATIRIIDPTTAAVTTLTGAPNKIGAANGALADARFYYPVAITYRDDKLYVTDTGNKDIRVIDLAMGKVSRLAGSGDFNVKGSDDGIGPAATFDWPYGLAFDPTGVALYVVDDAACVIRRIDTTTTRVSTIAGSAYDCDYADGDGLVARFATPQGIAADANGNIYVSEYNSHTVRKIEPPHWP
jgi:DNA-binding beta-propeller fold protein YncE